MNQDDDSPRDDALENTLRRHAPRHPEVALRAQVLAAVSAELAAERPARRVRLALRIPGWSVAASIALGVALNVWAMRGEYDRDASRFGSRPPLRRVTEIAEAVRSVTDVETGALIEQRLQAVCRQQELKSRSGRTLPLLSTQLNFPG